MRCALSAVALIALALASTACTAQLATGYAAPREDGYPRVLALQAQLVDPEIAGAAVGVGADAALGVDALSLRRGTLSVAYHHPTGSLVPLGFEAGLEVGFGEPHATEWDGPGVYLGPTATGLLRLAGGADDGAAFELLGARVDLALSGRGGVWAPPEGSDEGPSGEITGLLGVRLTLATDLWRAGGETQ